MRMNEGVEWAAHCAVILGALPADAHLSAARLAEYHGIPAPYLAKSLQALARAGIVDSITGRLGGYRLGRSASDVTLLDIVQAIEGNEPCFRCTEIRRQGPTRVAGSVYSSTCGIAAAMWRAEQKWQDELKRTTIADISAIVMSQAPSAALEKGVTWLASSLAARAPTGPR
jgi:Rrf2 family protein